MDRTTDLKKPIFDGDVPTTQREIMAMRVRVLQKCEAGYITEKVCRALLNGLGDLGRHLAEYGPSGDDGPTNGRAA